MKSQFLHVMKQLIHAVFTETGPDTGVFFGVVKLTGQHHTVHDQNDAEIKAHGHLSSNFGIDQ